MEYVVKLKENELNKIKNGFKGIFEAHEVENPESATDDFMELLKANGILIQ